jgi:nicotinate dehydrogenase subunit B
MTAPEGARRAAQPRTRADFHAARGVLLVVREPPPPPPPAPGQPPGVPSNPAEGVEILLALWDDGSVTALHGHVDLGTGLATAIAQVAAEELDLGVADVHVLLGHTAAVPNQGPTIASASLQVHAAPLRAAAAQARAWRDAHGLPRADDHVVLTLDLAAPVKDPARYRVVGQPVPRTDLPAKVHGEPVYVHDHRLPGMLHGRVIRPPYAGSDHGDFIGNSLIAVDEASVAHVDGLRAVVVIRDFVGVVAEREEQAEAAMRALHVQWKPWPGLPPVDDVAGALTAQPSTPRRLVDEGDVETAAVATRLDRSYAWPYQLHASIGPSCAVAHWHDDAAAGAGGTQVTVWAGTQQPHVLRADLARLLGLPDTAVDVVRLEAAGCYGRNGADDVAADAALLARAVRAPVRVQLTREQEHAWEPKGAAQWMTVRGGLDAQGGIAAWDFETRYPSNGAPTLALLLTRTIEPLAQAYQMGDRSARPPYRAPHLRVTVHDMAPILRASWLRGVSALPNSFAHESYVDELAHAAGADPVAFRLRHLRDDPRAAELIEATARRAGWLPHTQPMQRGTTGDWLHGQGFAYARYVHSKWPGSGAAWAAWVADVDVHRISGEVQVRRVVVGHDAGLMVNPAGVVQQIHGNVVQTTSRALKERVEVDARTGAVANREWGSYPILSFREVPVIEVLTIPRPGEPPLGAGESSSVPGTAAIANAIFDATGVRLREPPFTPEVVRAALGVLPAPASSPAAPASPAETSSHGAAVSAPASGSPGAVASASAHAGGQGLPAAARSGVPSTRVRRRPWWAVAGAVAAAAVGFVAGLLGGRGSAAPMAPMATPTGSGLYSAETLARGAVLASAANCIHCHTAPGGAAGAGGRAIETPYGTVHSTNITPDANTGIGRWSLAAFTRALREGVSRDGRHLYPAFPYTAFAGLADDDVTALYAHLMAQPAARAAVPANTLRFPYDQRALLPFWKALFHDSAPAPAATRGAYLVDAVGHCGACHSTRNALGAEAAYLGGGWAAGWRAPALTSANPAPLAWTVDDFAHYLRHGFSARHGAAAGPMAAVVRNLQPLSDADIRAMAGHLAALNTAPRPALRGEDRTLLPGPAQRLFQGACGACHHDAASGGGPEVFGLNLPLALNANLHAAEPDNVLQVILHGIAETPLPGPSMHGTMPAFRDNLSDAQVAQLAAYLRQRYAPDRPAWSGLEAASARIRQQR